MKCRSVIIFNCSILIFLLFMAGLPVYAQKMNRFFKVIDQQARPVPAATIKVMSEKDPSVFWEKLTDRSGKADFKLAYAEK